MWSCHILSHLDCTEQDTAVGMLKLGHDTLADVLALLRIGRLVLGKCREDRYPTPFGALVERDEELVENVRVNDKVLRRR